MNSISTWWSVAGIQAVWWRGNLSGTTTSDPCLVGIKAQPPVVPITTRGQMAAGLEAQGLETQ